MRKGFDRLIGGVVILVLFAFGMVSTVSAETFRMAVPKGSEDNFAFQIGAIRLAIANAPGEHQLEVLSVERLTQTRGLTMLRSGEINVIFAGYNPDFSEEFLQVDFPITRGLQGYRLFVIRADTQASLMRVKSLEDLKGFCIGSGQGWLDTAILKDAGLCVTEAPQNNLISMLENDRFDMMHLAVHEALKRDRVQQLKRAGLRVEETLLLRYQYDFFTYVGKNDKIRHSLLEQGFQNAFFSGAFNEYFRSDPSIAAAMDYIRQSDRRVIDLDNPGIGPKNDQTAEQYWLTE